MGPAVRPRPASPHGTPLPRKRATAGGKLPCHVRRRKHSTRRDMHRRALRSSVPIRRDSETRGDWTPALHRQRRWTTGPTGRSDPGGRRSRRRTVTLRHDLYRTHEGDSQRDKPPVATAGIANPCRWCGAWWGPSSGRSRHPHMALRFRGSVLRPTENHRVTCAGRTKAHSATLVVECGPAAESGGTGFRPPQAVAHGGARPPAEAGIPTCRSASGEACYGRRKITVSMRRWKHSAHGDANRRAAGISQSTLR